MACNARALPHLERRGGDASRANRLSPHRTGSADFPASGCPETSRLRDAQTPAILRMVKPEGALNLTEQIKPGALANSGLNLEIVEEWFPAEQEAWQRLDREERAPVKATAKIVAAISS